MIAKRIMGIRRPTGDLFAMALPAGEVVGRIGCHLNGCCYGIRCEMPGAVFQHGALRFPAQLVSSATAAVMFGVLLWLAPKLKREGDLFRAYLLLFGTTRFAIEFVRWLNSPEQDAKRKALNEFIRTSGLFDGVVDFDKVAGDPASGEMKAEFVPESTTGGPGDKLHPNRAGYLAMGNAIDLEMVVGMPLGRYFVFVGSLLLALLILADRYMPKPINEPARADVAASVYLAASMLLLQPLKPAIALFDSVIAFSSSFDASPISFASVTGRG